MLVRLARRSCYAGLQPAVTMLPCSLHAGLQLEVAKRIVTAARKVVVDDSAALVACGIANVQGQSCHHHVIACEFTDENTLGISRHETLRFFG